jgi:hypothetical protein
MQSDTVPDQRPDPEAAVAFDRLIDWAIGALLGVVGLLVALGGVALYYGTDRSDVATLIRDAEFQSDILTEAEAIDALTAFGQWCGIGLVVAGAMIVLFGVAVVVAHGRARTDGRGTPRWILGVVGAIVSIVLGFVPFSPVVGGAAAGYLDPNQDASGIGTGIFAGLFVLLPVLVVAFFSGVGLFVGLPGEVAAVVAASFIIAILVALAYSVGLSALGGYLGSWLRDR